MKKQGGFTLVELLVVIGIIALLVAILLAALKRPESEWADAKSRRPMRGGQSCIGVRQLAIPAVAEVYAFARFFPPTCVLGSPSL